MTYKKECQVCQLFTGTKTKISLWGSTTRVHGQFLYTNRGSKFFLSFWIRNIFWFRVAWYNIFHSTNILSNRRNWTLSLNLFTYVVLDFHQCLIWNSTIFIGKLYGLAMELFNFMEHTWIKELTIGWGLL